MMRIVSQGLSNIEELERMEIKEVAKSLGVEKPSVYVAKQKSTDLEGLYLSNPLGSND